MKKFLILILLATTFVACKKGPDSWYCKVYDDSHYTQSKYYADSTALSRTQDEMHIHAVLDYNMSGLPGVVDSAVCERLPVYDANGMIAAYQWFLEYELLDY